MELLLSADYGTEPSALCGYGGRLSSSGAIRSTESQKGGCNRDDMTYQD